VARRVNDWLQMHAKKAIRAEVSSIGRAETVALK
jgi:hypothetical protein